MRYYLHIKFVAAIASAFLNNPAGAEDIFIKCISDNSHPKFYWMQDYVMGNGYLSFYLERGFLKEFKEFNYKSGIYNIHRVCNYKSLKCEYSDNYIWISDSNSRMGYDFQIDRSDGKYQITDYYGKIKYDQGQCEKDFDRTEDRRKF